MSTSVKVKVPKKPAVKKAKKVKVPPTPEEVKKFLTDNKTELQQVIAELQAENDRLKPLNLKQTGLLMAEAIKNIQEDIEDVEMELEELNNPESAQ